MKKENLKEMLLLSKPAHDAAIDQHLFAVLRALLYLRRAKQK